jgi:predicted RNase H-like HicB family nuclease
VAAPLSVSAFWDAEAAVWVAESDDVPGLVTEAETMEELVAKLKVLIPELLEANGVLPPGSEDLEFRLTASRQERAPRSAA